MKPNDQRPRLAVAAATELGQPTIMDAALAAVHGGVYVRCAAYLIDVDRYFQSIEAEALEPLHWEIFLSECYILRHLTPSNPSHAALMEDIVESAVASVEEKGECYGSQTLLAILDIQRRGKWPTPIPALHDWQRPPQALFDTLAPLFSRQAESERRYATACLQHDLDPPAAPPTMVELRALAQPSVVGEPRDRLT